MASNKSSDQDELNDSVSKADIDKMIRFYMHILIIRLSKIRNLDIAHQRRLSLRQKVLL